MEGQTILQVARANGIHIPTLCYLEGLTPWGGCRMCIVEVKGSTKLVTSCSAPAVDGMEVVANSERLTLLRKRTLELLFTEGNHVCPICPYNKGDCELQQAGYAHGITGVTYSYLYPAKPVDLSGRYFGMDHNRCILCGRCIRTCDEVEGVHTLDYGHRGIKNRVVADMGKPFGDSTTCTECGACVANCPTGALFDKMAAFRGSLSACTQVRTTCIECPVGCGLRVFLKDARVINVFGDPASPVNLGHLCVKGRYHTWAEPRQRVMQPLVRRNGAFEPVSWDQAVEIVRELYRATGKQGRALLIGPRLTEEAAVAIGRYADRFAAVGTAVSRNEGGFLAVASYVPDAMEKIRTADTIIVVGAQPSRDNGVVAAGIRVAVRHRGAKLLIFHARRSDLNQLATVCANVVSLERAFWKEVAKTIKDATRVVVVYGPEAVTPVGLTVLDKLTEALEVGAKRVQAVDLVPLPRSANALRLRELGFEPVDDLTVFIGRHAPGLVHFVLSDDPNGGAQLLEERGLTELLKQVGALVVQSAYRSALTDLARVVLPAPIWSEKSGTVTNIEGRKLQLQPVLQPPSGVQPDELVLGEILRDM